MHSHSPSIWTIISIHRIHCHNSATRPDFHSVARLFRFVFFIIISSFFGTSEYWYLQVRIRPLTSLCILPIRERVALTANNVTLDRTCVLRTCMRIRECGGDRTALYRTHRKKSFEITQAWLPMGYVRMEGPRRAINGRSLLATLIHRYAAAGGSAGSRRLCFWSHLTLLAATLTTVTLTCTLALLSCQQIRYHSGQAPTPPPRVDPEQLEAALADRYRRARHLSGRADRDGPSAVNISCGYICPGIKFV